MRDDDHISAARFGFWTALGTAVTTAITFVVAILTPPLSGQLCTAGCFQYPYLEIAGRFPRDYYWLFPAMPAVLFFVAFVISLTSGPGRESRPLGRFAVILAMMAGLTLLGNYFVQLAVIQPSVLAGESDGISLLSQYNPHGVFIALEELGYLLMSLSLVCVVPSLSKATRPARVVRRLFVGGFVANLMALGFMLHRHGHARGYLFEIAVITIDWLVLIPAAALMTASYRRQLVDARRAFGVETARTSPA